MSKPKLNQPDVEPTTTIGGYSTTLSEYYQQIDNEQIKFVKDKVEYADKMKSIEEELGIDLITLFKALKEGIFVAYDSAFGMTNKPKIKITKDTATGICYRDKKWYIQENETFLKDYGKTWALTKEELENDKRI